MQAQIKPILKAALIVIFASSLTACSSLSWFGLGSKKKQGFKLSPPPHLNTPENTETFWGAKQEYQDVAALLDLAGPVLYFVDGYGKRNLGFSRVTLNKLVLPGVYTRTYDNQAGDPSFSNDITTVTFSAVNPTATIFLPPLGMSILFSKTTVGAKLTIVDRYTNSIHLITRGIAVNAEELN